MSRSEASVYTRRIHRDTVDIQMPFSEEKIAIIRYKEMEMENTVMFNQIKSLLIRLNKS